MTSAGTLVGLMTFPTNIVVCMDVVFVDEVAVTRATEERAQSFVLKAVVNRALGESWDARAKETN